jgi:hypothetical protein
VAQRCHLAHDRASHLLQRWITYRLRYARGDLFLGPYRHGPATAVLMPEILAGIAERLTKEREEDRALSAQLRLLIVTECPSLSQHFQCRGRSSNDDLMAVAAPLYHGALSICEHKLIPTGVLLARKLARPSG